MPPRTKKGRAEARALRKSAQRDRTPGIRDYGPIKSLRAVGRALNITKIAKYVTGLPPKLGDDTSVNARLVVQNDLSGEWNAFALLSQTSPFAGAAAPDWQYYPLADYPRGGRRDSDWQYYSRVTGDQVIWRHDSDKGRMRPSGHVSLYSISNNKSDVDGGGI
jgi:hypothetical protein